MLDEMDRADVAPNHVVYNTLVASLAKAEKVRSRPSSSLMRGLICLCSFLCVP